MRVELFQKRVEDIDADALLVPVDGPLKVLLGGGALSGIKASLLSQRIEIQDEGETLRELNRELTGFREEFERELPTRIKAGSAVVVDGIARWRHLVLADCLRHNQNDRVFTPEEHAAVAGAGVHAAVLAAENAGIQTLLITPIGTSTRMEMDRSIATIVRGLAARSSARITIRWSFIDPPPKFPDAPSAAAASAAARAACVAQHLDVESP